MRASSALSAACTTLDCCTPLAACHVTKPTNDHEYASRHVMSMAESDWHYSPVIRRPKRVSTSPPPWTLAQTGTDPMLSRDAVLPAKLTVGLYYLEMLLLMLMMIH